jgi:hypothetical protein
MRLSEPGYLAINDVAPLARHLGIDAVALEDLPSSSGEHHPPDSAGLRIARLAGRLLSLRKAAAT